MLRKMFDWIAGFALWSVGFIVVIVGAYNLALGAGLGQAAGPVAAVIAFGYVCVTIVVGIAEAGKRDWL